MKDDKKPDAEREAVDLDIDVDRFESVGDIGRGSRMPNRKPVTRFKPLAEDDAIFRLIGIVSSEENAGLSANKYVAFGDAFAPNPNEIP